MYPRWLTEPLDDMNLREVAPGLYVGDELSPRRGHWHTIIDLYGTESPVILGLQKQARWLVRAPFLDGDAFPPGVLDTVWDAWQRADIEHGDTLIHCHAGLSRSASAAYAMLRKRYGLSHAEAMYRVVTPLTAHQFPLRTTLTSASEWVRKHR